MDHNRVMDGQRKNTGKLELNKASILCSFSPLFMPIQVDAGNYKTIAAIAMVQDQHSHTSALNEGLLSVFVVITDFITDIPAHFCEEDNEDK